MLRRITALNLTRSTRRAVLPAALVVSCAFWGSSALGQNWSELTQQQRQELAEFQELWPELSTERRARLIATSRQIARMPAANRSRLKDNLSGGAQRPTTDPEFRRLSPEMQARLRAEWDSMTPQEREQAIQSQETPVQASE